MKILRAPLSPEICTASQIEATNWQGIRDLVWANRQVFLICEEVGVGGVVIKCPDILQLTEGGLGKSAMCIGTFGSWRKRSLTTYNIYQTNRATAG